MFYNEKMEEKKDIIYEKFRTTGQEKVKMACALEGFFQKKMKFSQDEKKIQKEYEKYLQRRIRSVMEYLILEEDLDRMKGLEPYGWWGKIELEQFIRIAREHQKIESLVWLLNQKDQKYGYEDRDLTL